MSAHHFFYFWTWNLGESAIGLPGFEGDKGMKGQQGPPGLPCTELTMLLNSSYIGPKGEPGEKGPPVSFITIVEKYHREIKIRN